MRLYQSGAVDLGVRSYDLRPALTVHALTLRERFGDALEKVIMGLYSGGVRIIAGPAATASALATPAGPSPR